MPACSIAHKELIPIVMAAFIWGRSWQGKIVLFWCDNEAVVTVVNKLYCRDLKTDAYDQMPGFYSCEIPILVRGYPHSWYKQCTSR